MKVLLLNGSPRGKYSNSLKLTYSFLEGMKSIDGSIEVTEITIDDLQVESCRGCFGCWWGKNPGKCVLSDDMEKLLPEIIGADVIVWSFPLYYYNVPGKMKTVIDRQLPTILPNMEKDAEFGGHPSRYDFSRQKQVLISTCGFYTAEGNYNSVTAMFDHMYGKGNYETVFTGEGGLFNNEQAKPVTDAYLAKVFKAGKEYASGGITEETRESLREAIIPRESYEGAVNGTV